MKKGFLALLLASLLGCNQNSQMNGSHDDSGSDHKKDGCNCSMAEFNESEELENNTL